MLDLKSFESLDVRLAWQRVRAWARSDAMDIPDRLPYEVLHRLYGDAGPPILYRHRSCGQITHVEPHCAVCGEIMHSTDVDVDVDVDVELGPGLAAA